MADIISGVGASSNATAMNYAERMPVQKLDQDDFIKILVAQLTSQDPMNPQKDTEFVGQMAQFSALESTKSMQVEMQTMRANTMIGQTVEINADDTVVIGEVTGVVNVMGEPKIMVDDNVYSLSDVVRVERTAATPVSNPPVMVPATAQ
jgi:flagellar basal-body rod modification protein FlgD